MTPPQCGQRKFFPVRDNPEFHRSTQRSLRNDHSAASATSCEVIYRNDGGRPVSGGGFGPDGGANESSSAPERAHSSTYAALIPMSSRNAAHNFSGESSSRTTPSRVRTN